MNILFTTAEASPFAKVGGLGDVVAAGSLPAALRRQGVDARVIMPMYGTVDRERHGIEYLSTFQFTRQDGTADVHLHFTEQDGVPFYFVEVWPYFGQGNSVYTDWSWDVPRFIMFNQIVLAAAWELNTREGWFPDIFHAHDWHTGMVPFLLAEAASEDHWRRAGSVMTIHNMAHQGNYIGGWLYELGIPGRTHPDLLQRNLGDNMLAMGIAYADEVTTVSPRHAIEIQYPYMGYGLDDLIRTRGQNMTGILNGIDVKKFDPAIDANIPSNFDADNFREKRIANKRNLQESLGLPVRDDVMLMGLVSRVEWQKGIDMAIPAVRQLLTEADMQFVALGTGAPDLTTALGQIGLDFPEKARTYIQFDLAFAQRIYAGCDVFLMPSHYEPCGIGQMIAMRYGSLPLVRETGGLADTVANYDDGPADYGTGFVFSWEEANAILNTARWALDIFHNRKTAWERMQERGMRKDQSWDRSAHEYIELYERILRRKRLDES